MSVVKIQVSNDHAQALRESLLTARRAIEEQLPLDDRPAAREHGAPAEGAHERLGELDSLLEQIDAGDRPDPDLDVCELTGTRAALWTVVYDAACAASEQLAEELNEYWRGTVDATEVHAQIAGLGTRFELLESLGPPPGE